MSDAGSNILVPVNLPFYRVHAVSVKIAGANRKADPEEPASDFYGGGWTRTNDPP